MTEEQAKQYDALLAYGHSAEKASEIVFAAARYDDFSMNYIALVTDILEQRCAASVAAVSHGY